MTAEEYGKIHNKILFIKNNARDIAVKENFNNKGFKSYTLDELPPELAINHSLRWIDDFCKSLVEVIYEQKPN